MMIPCHYVIRNYTISLIINHNHYVHCNIGNIYHYCVHEALEDLNDNFCKAETTEFAKFTSYESITRCKLYLYLFIVITYYHFQ
jgi:hypothetical protein